MRPGYTFGYIGCFVLTRKSVKLCRYIPRVQDLSNTAVLDYFWSIFFHFIIYNVPTILYDINKML